MLKQERTNSNKNIPFQVIWSRFGTFGILLLLVVVMGILSPKYFLQTKNMSQIILQSSITILIACGEFFAILIAGIDLSVGSILGLTGMIAGKLMMSGMNMWAAILIGGVLFGALLGCVNGFLVNKTGLHPFIITLGTQAIYRGLTLVISNARPIYGFPADFKNIIGGWVLGVPIPAIIALVYAALLGVMLRKTIMGRNIYAVGGNIETAWYSGININLHRITVFVISGISAGLAGIVMNARLGSAEPLAGTAYETQAIASVIIGGASFFGGKGNIFGVVMGGLIIGVISNGLNILNVPTYYQQIVMGSLIILAVTLDKLVSRKK